jgi:hypothetical protein
MTQMTLTNIEIDYVLCRALKKRPGESLLAAAERTMMALPGEPARNAAAILLRNDSGDVWVTMRAAHRSLTRRRKIVTQKCVECLSEPRRYRHSSPRPAVSGDLCALHAGRRYTHRDR